MQRETFGDNDEAIKRLIEKISALKVAEATVANASAKFEISKELEDAELMLSKLMKIGLVEGELGLEASDSELLDFYFQECVNFDNFFEPHVRGEIESREQFLIYRGLAYKSSKGALALTEEGILFCALRDFISSNSFHVHVRLQWDDGKLIKPEEEIWGSVLYLHRELTKRLDPLSSRIMGNPENRNTFGSEKAISEYPRVAIIEALTNFLIHRDYREDDHGRINIFNDRIEFINPGISTILPETLLTSMVDLAPKYSRNMRLIEVMSLSRLNQRKGSGIRRIREVLTENETVLADGSIGLKLWNDEINCRFHLVIYRRNLTTFNVTNETSTQLTAYISHIDKYAPQELIGREKELEMLDDAWNNPEKNIVVVRAFGGVGKTSLVATWIAEMGHKKYFDGIQVFDWSFYSQGTRDHSAASTDTFLNEALKVFGDPDHTSGSPWDKGARLAYLVGKNRCLLVLDGLEPLQHPPGPMAGIIKDPGMTALLKGLASHNAGLCIVTTREKIPDIQQHYGRSADDIELSFLTPLAGAALLYNAGARWAGAKEIDPDDSELQAASSEVNGHGLTLQLLGQYLRLAENGDILKRDIVRLADADHEYQNDPTRPYGHAFKAMEAYEKWFESEGENGQRQLAILRLLGLFDRPASKSCFNALSAKPVIAGLTNAIVNFIPRDWRICLQYLEDIQLITVNRDNNGTLITIDCHPLLREYFSQQLSIHQPEAYCAAHKRLFEHLCKTTTDKNPQPTLEDLQPLYQAIVHGCQAGLHQEALHKVYRGRILRKNENYSVSKLGAFSQNLGAVACFFETPWCRVSSALTETNQAYVLYQAALYLCALGRLTEAIEPIRIGLDMSIKQEDWQNVAIRASNLSELKLTLGDVAGAMGDAEQSVIYADRSGDVFQRKNNRTTHADILHQAGRQIDAEAHFRESEQMQTEHQPTYPLLYGLAGFRYCDLLLMMAERSAWQYSVGIPFGGSICVTSPKSEDLTVMLLESCRIVSKRAVQTLKWIKRYNFSLLDIALDHLTLGRAALYAAVFGESENFNLKFEIEEAVSGLRRAGAVEFLVRGLLTRTWLRAVTSAHTGPDSAQTDLDEAWEIAERGPMPLHMVDIHLYRARLFFREVDYPWESAEYDLAEARRLIEKHGYWRRKEELEDAEEAINL